MEILGFGTIVTNFYDDGVFFFSSFGRVITIEMAAKTIYEICVETN